MIETRERFLCSTEKITDIEADQRLKTLNDVLKEARLVVDERHQIRLTPERLVLNSVAKLQFEQIGQLILSSFVATERLFLKAKRRQLPSDLSSFIASALEAGMRKVDKKTLGEQIGQMPLFFRSDCVLANTEDGFAVKLTEIEGERSIGFGFASFVDRLNNALNSTARTDFQSGKGIAEGVKTAFESSPFAGRDLGLILGEDQLFYLPEQQLFARQLSRLGVPIELIQEKQIQLTQGGSLQLILSSGKKVDSAVCLPVFNPAKSGKTLEAELLRLGFIDSRFRFALPPKKFFGTKSPLALMHQVLIREMMAEEGVDLNLVDKFIPTTRIIAGQISEVERLILSMGLQTDPPTLIKAVGMTAGRGMVMPGSREDMTHFVNNVVNKPDNRFEFVTQQFLDSPSVPFRIEDPLTREIRKEPQFMRLGAFFANIKGEAVLLGVVGTGLDNVFVHGNPRCIQFPVVFEEDR